MNNIDYCIIISGILINLCVFLIKLYIFYHKTKNIQFLITFVEAPTGQGKTSLSIALAKCWHKNYEDKVKQMFSKEYEELKANGYPEVKSQCSTLCHSDTTAFLTIDKNKGIRVPFEDCDFSKFDIPTETNFRNIDYYPLGSYFIFDEIVNKARSRDWTNFSNTKAVCLDFHRKVGYNITFISPDFNSAEKTLRVASHIIRVVQGLKIKQSKKGEIKSITWYFVDYYGKNKEENADKGVIPKFSYKPFEFYPEVRKDIMKWKYTFKGNIFDYYDSYRERLYFYRHLVKFKSKPCREYLTTRFDSNALCKDHPVMTNKDERSVFEKRTRKEIDDE
jgi:hypothetical protein